MVAGAPEIEAAIEQVAPLPTVSPFIIAPSREAGSRAPARPGPTKTAMGNYRPYRGRRGENRPAPSKPSARAANVEEIQHV